MAGYIFNLDHTDALERYVSKGVYATKLSTPNGRWLAHHEGTAADYATMQPGDDVFFFIKRKLYGIGKMSNINGDCRFINFPGADLPNRYEYDTIQPLLLWDEGPDSSSQRWICCFEPSPAFFTCGIDMDDVLSSNPSAFRMLRTFQGLSFIKIDDEESQALRDILLRENQAALHKPDPGLIFPSQHVPVHQAISSKVNNQYCFAVENILKACSHADTISHEMAIECAILYQLTSGEQHTISILGDWDYISHQVIASPFKPLIYVDKMDIFGYKYLAGFRPTIASYLVMELKRVPASEDDVDQVLKYVDWVKDEYSFGDYSLIKAYLVASSFSESVINHAKNKAMRLFMKGRHPARTMEWSNLGLISYSFDGNKILLNREWQG